MTLVLACTAQPIPTPASVASPTAPVATPAPSSNLTAAPSLIPLPTPDATSWTQLFTIERGSLGDIVSGPDGLIAAGCIGDTESDCHQRVLVTSRDGKAWQEVDIDSPADIAFGSLQRVGGRLFVLGYGHYGPDGGAVIHTSVDGSSWSRLVSSSFRARAVTDMIDTPKGTLAIGHEAPIDSDNTSGFVVWPVGADGAFGTARTIDTGDGPSLVTGGMWTGEEFLAWGVRNGPLGDGPTTLLASLDGKAWTVRADMSGTRGSDVMQIIVAGDRLVAVGYEGRTFPVSPRAWTSEDAGRSWRMATVPSDNAAIYAVTLEGSRLIARGKAFSDFGSQQQTVSWTSTDGTTWTRIPDDEDMPAVAGFSALTRATIADQTCVAGTFYDEAPIRAAIYCRPTMVE